MKYNFLTQSWVDKGKWGRGKVMFLFYKRWEFSDAQLPQRKPEPSTAVITTSVWDARGKHNRKWDRRKQVQFLKLLVFYFAVWGPASLARYLHLLEQLTHLSIPQLCPEWVFNKWCLLIHRNDSGTIKKTRALSCFSENANGFALIHSCDQRHTLWGLQTVTHDQWVFQEGTRGLVLGQPHSYWNQPN